MAEHDDPDITSSDGCDWLDETADRFDRAWKTGAAPCIGAFLGAAPANRRLELFAELVKIDMEYRQKAGAPWALEDYRREYPDEWAQADQPVREDLAQYAQRLTGGSEDGSPQALPAAIGRYIVVGPIDDRGGQALVYRGIHPLLTREVAIKLSRDPVPPEELDWEQWRREGQILADLKHPHIAQVFDLDLHEGRPFLVMEYVRGQNLEQYAIQERPTPRPAAALLAKVARALAAAHRRGVIHRDVKPKNILIDEAGEPRVIDFGLAQLRHAWAEDEVPPDSISGTVHYMPPEQAQGKTGHVDQRSDVFGLGAVLYFLLVGRAPYAAPTFREALRRAQECDFDDAPVRGSKAPRRLAAICLKAMDPDPEHRYASADALAEDLERFSRKRSTWPWLLRAAACLVLAVATWGLVKVLWPSRPPPPRPLAIRVYRDGWRPLADAVPLRSGDKVQLSGEVPPGVHLSVFGVNGDGIINRLEDIPAGDRPRPFYLPDPNGPLPEPIDGPAGTDFVLVCGKTSGPASLEEIQSLWDSTQNKWPALPERSVLRLQFDQVREEGEKSRDLNFRPGRGEPQPDPEGDVKRRLEELGRQLRGRFDYVEGLAFSHQEKKPDGD